MSLIPHFLADMDKRLATTECYYIFISGGMKPIDESKESAVVIEGEITQE